MLKTRILQKITGTPNLGLLPHIKDEKNLKVGIFGWGKYKPKHDKIVLEVLSHKNQYKNTCGWAATAGSKERDEKYLLDTRTIVCVARREGKISGDGFSSLKANEEVLHNFGIGEYRHLQGFRYRNWNEYSDSKLLTPKLLSNMQDHKTDSYWEVERTDHLYKYIDEKRTIKIGIDWATGFNIKNGFKAPWIISKIIGYVVGGHAMFVKGYDATKNLFIIQNSFGKDWGDHGDLYIEEKWLQKQINKYGAFVNLDIKSDIGKILMEMDGKNVKAEGNSAVYHIQKGKKKVYPDSPSYFAYNKSFDGIELVDQRILDEIPESDIMDIKKSVHWDLIKNLKYEDVLSSLIDNYIKEK